MSSSGPAVLVGGSVGVALVEDLDDDIFLVEEGVEAEDLEGLAHAQVVVVGPGAFLLRLMAPRHQLKSVLQALELE